MTISCLTTTARMQLTKTENVLKSNYSSTCSRENVCKFLFHCYTYAYGALGQGVWCTVQVQRKT
ncbi:hypothetical protein T02_13742 [Trichinella nativa]|uniref:Uncharacterized protein n=1 Tax=Trichinella nativa TaxID=6335 RepID=A0A0V1KKC7_9BILA|nr:hypothetical protein T02_13742 [Trichinella nativa]